MCEQCDNVAYEAYECCASGSCEVCRGTQGRIRERIRKELGHA